MFENPRRGRQARHFTKKVPKILDLESSWFQTDIFRKLTLGAPDKYGDQVQWKCTRQMIPCKQRLHFRGMRWRAKSSLCRQPFNFLSCMRKIRHAIRKQLVRQICVSFAGIKIAKTTCEQLSSSFCFVFLLCPSGFKYFSRKFPRIVFWESTMLPTIASPVWFEESAFNSKRQFFVSGLLV